MTPRTAIIATALTAFVLTIVGVAASYLHRTPPEATVPVAVVQAREAEYRRRLEEANARIRELQTPPAPTRRARAIAREEEHEDDDG